MYMCICVFCVFCVCVFLQGATFGGVVLCVCVCGAVWLCYGSGYGMGMGTVKGHGCDLRFEVLPVKLAVISDKWCLLSVR